MPSKIDTTGYTSPVEVSTGKTKNLSTTDQTSLRHDVQVELQYLVDDPIYDSVKPVQITPNFADDERRTNVRLCAGDPENLNDVRGREKEFSLDANGFKFVKAPTSFKDWSSQPKIGQVYLKEMEDLLKREVEGCDEIIFYDARIRQEGEKGLKVEGLSYNPFARQVHVDNTERSVIEKVKALTEMKSDFLLRGRYQIINIWRPIKHPVYDCGLAVADGGKLKKGDVRECERHRRDTQEYWDTMGVIKYRPGFRWYYMSYQDEEDCLLFKNHDSALDVPARFCLHTAFDMPPEEILPDMPTRESIEVRALVFTHPRGERRASETRMLQQSTPIPHPLAEKLERQELKRIDDELTITDRLREDIDEANEVKDAVLLLRRKEIKHLEQVNQKLAEELRESNDENQRLLRRIERQEQEIQKWRTEAMGPR
ncbi:hypothetical protein K431DRAFT_286843 [Polychaeton citri CBS 116435]|uniref:Uncharacterized protein n=1 Tax=Polychaeton citri CBS 116435 TaxID=1314669 RepID=A0A9P4UN38_9PEZI|nr:hypothetical protein K431DRAFT_286843 [Polychaeton citri CBS 116435]